MSGNILNFNVKKLELRLSDSEYYDFYLAKDGRCKPNTSSVSGESSGSLVVHYDFNNPSIYEGNTIYSLSSWSGATNKGYELDTIGLTGLDNGLVTFNKSDDDYSNESLFSALTESLLVIPSGDTRLALTRVTGSTGDIVYPMNISYDENVGDVMTFCGGFYQGFYKIEGTDYQVLPNRAVKEWSMEFWMKKSDSVCSGETGTTLNDIYPDNKGIFFYWGTRAENKFWNSFDGLNSGDTCNSGSTEWCTPIKEDEVNIIDDKSGMVIPLDSNLEEEITEIDNNFLIYGRAKPPCSTLSGGTNCNCNRCKPKEDILGTKTVCNFSGGSIFVTSFHEARIYDTNPFLIYGRACKKDTSSSCNCNRCKSNDGYGTETVCSYSAKTTNDVEINPIDDVVDNAFAFMVKDDGSIGYRLLTLSGDCSGDTYNKTCVIEEEFSPSGCVKDDEWTNISVRFVSYERLGICDIEGNKPRKGRLMFYVNCRLKFMVDDFDEIIARKLDTHWKKQVGVPFNISLGGGSQGLIESMTFDGQDPMDSDLCVENAFAGSFIGQISQFRLNIGGLNWCELKSNCNFECERYNTCAKCKKKKNCGCK